MKTQTLVISRQCAIDALTHHLQTLSAINNNEYVSELDLQFAKNGSQFQLLIKKDKDAE